MYHKLCYFVVGNCAKNCHKCSTKGTAKCDVDGCDTGYYHNAGDDTCVGECLLYDLETAVVVRLDLCLSPSPYLSPSIMSLSTYLSFNVFLTKIPIYVCFSLFSVFSMCVSPSQTPASLSLEQSMSWHILG